MMSNPRSIGADLGKSCFIETLGERCRLLRLRTLWFDIERRGRRTTALSCVVVRWVIVSIVSIDDNVRELSQ